MFSKATSALTRAILVGVVILLPSLLVPNVRGETSQIIVLVALACSVLTMAEYASTYPSLIEFRDAPPFNRIRYLALFATLFILSLLARGKLDPSGLTLFIGAIGSLVGTALDFSYSPVRLVLMSMPESASQADMNTVRAAAGMAYLISLMAIIFFYLILKLKNWPSRSGAFNVWINLPTFDPTAGGDVVRRLNRDARINLALGFLLPFLIPVIGEAAETLFGAASLTETQTMIWLVTLWAFLPLSLFMRGIAMSRLADMILEMRRRSTLANAGGHVYAT